MGWNHQLDCDSDGSLTFLFVAVKKTQNFCDWKKALSSFLEAENEQIAEAGRNCVQE